MDRSLDDVIQERHKRTSRSSRDRRPPRDGIRKQHPNRRDNGQNLNSDWVHDRFDDDSDSRQPNRNSQASRIVHRDVIDLTQPDAKIRVDNLHYDLTEDDLRELFTRIGPIEDVQLLYDRQDRSRGTAFVVYSRMRDAHRAIEQFDGANANNQPIKLTLIPTQPLRAARNPFDTAERPGPSLFERIERSEDANRRRRGGRSDEEGRFRQSDVSKPPPDNIDRYVPGQDSGSERRRSPAPRRGGRSRGEGRGDARRPGQRKERETQVGKDNRPRKTAEELDAEMEDYWGGNGTTKEPATGTNGADPVIINTDDVDMIE